jgi:transcriptional regulator with XRE-family HTH domain
MNTCKAKYLSVGQSRIIQTMMILNGTSQVTIAAKAGVSRSAVNQVIHGRRRTPVIRQAIAEACGQAVDDLFPGEKGA